MLPLDDFAGLPRLRLVKIDIEGMEIEAIEGAKRLIAQFRPLLYVENDRVENSERMLRLIDDLGYDMYWHVTPLFNPDNAYGERDNIYEKLASFNVLGVHRDARANVVGVEKITDFASHPLRPGTVGTG